MSFSSFPITGEVVNIKYLEIDEIEAKCLILKYNMSGFLNNTELKLNLSDVGREDLAQIISTNNRIELKGLRF